MRQYVAYYKGQPIFGPRGPAGPDGNPVGTIISYMGLTAPQDYLVCDGTAYHITDYPELAAFFQEQFGSANHFGGDGEATFVVPDLRNLFLRGYHGEAEEPLSGEIGERQEATSFPALFIVGGGSGGNAAVMTDPGSKESISFKHADQSSGTPTIYAYSPTRNSADISVSATNEKERALSYTARPVNMAVLYCIKAVESVPAENVYSTKETRIGTWTDGKPLYRSIVTGTSGDAAAKTFCGGPKDVLKVIGLHGVMSTSAFEGQISVPNGTVELQYLYEEKEIAMWIYAAHMAHQTYTIIMEYTKTTD